MHMDFKSDYRVFLLNGSFSDIEFIIFLLNNDDKMVLSNSYIITIVKDVDQFSQLIARQKIEDNYNCKP